MFNEPTKSIHQKAKETCLNVMNAPILKDGEQKFEKKDVIDKTFKEYWDLLTPLTNFNEHKEAFRKAITPLLAGVEGLLQFSYEFNQLVVTFDRGVASSGWKFGDEVIIKRQIK